MARALLLLALLAAPAAADSAKAELARGMNIDESAVLAVEDFTLAAGPYHRALVGRFKNSDIAVGGIVLTWCDRAKKCWLSRAWLQKANDVHVLGIVDLAAGPTPFPTHPLGRYDRTALKQPKAKWPALLVRVTEREQTTTGSRYGGSKTGEHRRSELVVLSLALEDTKSPQIMRVTQDERWPTGAGMTASFELAKDGAIVATEQRHLESVSTCIRPKPTTTRYVFDKETRRFKEAGLRQRTGC